MSADIYDLLKIAAEELIAQNTQLKSERDEARAEMIRWMSIAEGRGRTDDEEENDTQSELAAWEMLTEATRELAEAREALRKAIRFVEAYEPHTRGVEADQNETLSIIRKALEETK